MNQRRFTAVSFANLCSLVMWGLFGAVNTAMAQRPSADEPPGEPAKAQPEDDLGQKLIRKAVGAADEDVMSRMIRLMEEASQKLTRDFDAGDKTQAVQTQILDQLNEAIKAAASKTRMKQQAAPSWTADRRKMARPAQADAKRAAAQPQRAGEPSSEEASRQAPSADPKKAAEGDLQETRRSWGNLPQRERDELIQGSNEAFLERYRQWIERYYQALQETGE